MVQSHLVHFQILPYRWIIDWVLMKPGEDVAAKLTFRLVEL